MIRFLALTLLLFSVAAKPQDYPARPITAIVPFSAGSASDMIARIVLERMGNAMNTRFIVDNRPAAGGVAGTTAAAKMPADGYTIVMGASGPMVVNKVLNPDVGFDPEKDFQPISIYANLPNVAVVTAKLPVNSLAELIDYVRKTPNVPYSSVGNGSSQHLAGALFEQLVGAKMQHVPYRITSQLQADLQSGQVPTSFQLVPNVIGAIKSGAVRPLAVASKQRLPALPDVPTAAEAGLKGWESSAWFGFFGPRGMPRPAVEKLNKEITAAIADPAVRARFTDFGAEPLTSTPEELGRYVSAEMVRWRDIITKAGIKLEQ
jgi:tripartite-type tricarboxylate transporter receptor subunit TctC